MTVQHVKLDWYDITLIQKSSGLPARYAHAVRVKQVHGVDILTVSEWAHWFQENEADGLICHREDAIPLSVYTADCTPLAFLWKHHYGVIHAGRRWLSQGILSRAVKSLCRQGEEVFDIAVYVWPTISWEMYEVGQEFLSIFGQKYVRKVWPSRRFCQRRFVFEKLLEVWISARSLHFHPDCTYRHNHLRASRRRKDVWVSNFLCVKPI